MLRNWLTQINSWFTRTKFYREYDIILEEFNFFWKSFTAGVLISIAASLFEGLGVGLLINLLQTLSGETSTNLISQSWIHVLIYGENQEPHIQILRVSGLILLTTLLRAILMYRGALELLKCKTKILEQLRIRLFNQIAAFDVSYFSKNRSGDIVNTLTAEINLFQSAITGISQLITKSLYLPVYFAFIAVISLPLALIASVLLSILPLILVYVRRKIKQASLKSTQANKDLTSIVVEFMNGIQLIHSFSTQDYERKRFNRRSKKVSSALHQQHRYMATAEPLTEFLSLTVMVLMVFVGYNIFQLPLSNLLGFIYVLLRLVQTLRLMNVSIVGISQLHGSMQSIRKLLNKQDKTFFQDGKIIFSSFGKGISIESLTFGYDAQSPVLKNISLLIEKGSNVAFVGSSGSGKSTFVSLLLRLYDPTEGQITIDGVNIRDYNINSYRRQVTIVSQDTFLFNATVRENIAYGLEDAKENFIHEAAELAYAIDFIRELPNGFDTILGDRGVRLSGGQRQRLAIARAILRKPEILILDEATSALDNISEKMVQSAIEKLSSGRTVISIAHRLSTIQNADMIYVLEKGSIVENGTYGQLINQKGKFWETSQIFA